MASCLFFPVVKGTRLADPFLVVVFVMSFVRFIQDGTSVPEKPLDDPAEKIISLVHHHDQVCYGDPCHFKLDYHSYAHTEVVSAINARG